MSDKSKCPVFGCIIPRGVPHEHPAGVSAVMRDPVSPLSADERAELESFRRERDLMTREGLKAFSQHDTYVVPADAIMHGGRKLRDALLMAGQIKVVRDLEHSATRDKTLHESTVAASNLQMAAMVEIMNAPLRQLADEISGMDFGKALKAADLFGASDMHRPTQDFPSMQGQEFNSPRRTLAQSVGKFMAWIFAAIGVASIIILMAMSAGWM